ncbi:hypothetical protein PHYBLDRAFT_153773 [Phycomyces blakesleeanus NRRL 1555(-)]|uniref:Uncharacterized protein n=1 Tax=Phycomyces blakesleeanus (strain ATCC 8743b / DSM 1359 / FGSC 10004 / NBRC 33097 / NRRL 1555) TaxID=763407 RepID=A0A162N2C9_PHYB8|nr:hypothetical protein PHYBLDRAFT_153773 [Phycomyces blakesleeanus NRRL 1555(-)]OAD65114.1 hypothetical protein PHYBLDRAFT_153773 [Phycomyces blakesleeanus NRRL 1555(-)]|eukprot:XP_018283154.1 hypothetical protein PHYBLDRAFT_153773 [Phycomyces blakesleeanus NRRL 1555(-)]
MVNLAAQHSFLLGYCWSPSKCAIVYPSFRSPHQQQLSIYGELLPAVQEFIYLGVPFRNKGICGPSVVSHHHSGTLATMSNLNSVGACRSGFSLLLSSRLYKTFVRPIFEYGLAITILRKKDYTEIERIQDKCLRMIVGGHATSSTAVLKHICNLPSMQFCSDILISNFCICAQSLLSGCLLSLLHLHHPQSSSLPALSKNSLFVSIPITLNFHSNTKLKRFFETFHQFKFDQMRLTNTKVLLQACHLLWWLKLKKFLRGRIEDLRLGMKIRENLCRFCLLRKIWYQSLVRFLH